MSGEGILRGSRAQATIEALAGALLLVVLGLVSLQAFWVWRAHAVAAAAAEAGALALVAGGDPARAVRESLTPAQRRRLSLAIGEREIVVALRPRSLVPGISERALRVEARAAVAEP